MTDFGTDDEVLEVVQKLFWDDEYEASRLVERALDAGVRFKDENIVELTAHCNEDTIKQVVFLSRLLLTEESLEELYGNVSDDIIIQVAKEQNLRLPEDLREEEEEPEDISYEVHVAMDAADYAWDCLVQAQRTMNDNGSASVLDMLTTGLFTSFLKQATLSEADEEVRQAQIALNALNMELRELSKNKTVQLKYVRLATAIDCKRQIMRLPINERHQQISAARFSAFSRKFLCPRK